MTVMDARSVDRVLQAAAQVTTRDERQAAILGAVVQTLCAGWNAQCLVQQVADNLLADVRDAISTREEAALYQSLIVATPVDIAEVSEVVAMWRSHYEVAA